ncbi:uncharacterized protein [Acropora muricata]|uniref:uncharacterized protein isoform X5 n=1 Tax=Acropora muricata TaxID=159855 RepID=UPI0034E4AF20
MEILLETALKTQTIIGGIHFVFFIFSWPFVIGFLKDYHDKDRLTFNCEPKPSDYTRQLCYHDYVSSLSPLLTPLDVAGITYGVSGFLWVSFIITGVWLKKRIERPGSDESDTTSLMAFKKIFFCHVCLQLAFLVVMVVLFCGFQTLEFPAMFPCTRRNITLSSTNQFPPSNMICNDLRYKEKSKLNTSIIVIMSVSILLGIVTMLHLVVTRGKLFEQLIGDITTERGEQTYPLVREAVDGNNTPSGEAVDANNTPSGEAVDTNNTPPAYTKEELNFFKVCYIVSGVLQQGLCSIFKQEWDNRYKTTLGEWQDTQKNGWDFFNAESSVNQRRRVGFLATMKRGDRAEWDCTMLFYAILYSNSIHQLDPQIRSNVGDLRKFRNTCFAHVAGGRLSDLLFDDAVRKVESAFHALGLPVAKIQTIKTSFLTDLESPPVLTNIEEEPHGLRREESRVQKKVTSLIHSEKEQRHKQSFCILPPVPPHQIADREGDVTTIVNKLKNLRHTNKNRISYFYISGNPGSGKSQLARLVAKRVYDKTIDRSSSPSLVNTLNAENMETLLESYVSLAALVSCPESTVTSIHSSKDKAIEEKINNLKNLIGTKISFYEWWLLVVDNVTNLSDTLGFLPELGNEQWGNGQLLITTQDCSCIPPNSSESLCCHISISKGMTSGASGFLLATISGIKDDATGANEVAEALDHQPLALASAAFYAAKVREFSSNFGWNDYLIKLNEGKRALTEKVLAKASQFYSKTMTAAIQIAVERELNYDELMKHVFTFLAYCEPQPLRLDILTNYVLNVDKHQDKEDIGLRIQGSSLILIDKRKDGVYIRLHNVVHDIVKLSVINDSMNSNEHVRNVDAAVMSFNQFIDETIPWSWNKLDSVAQTKHFVGHLKTLSKEIGSVFAATDLEKRKVLSHFITDISRCSFHLRRLGRITQCNGEFRSAREYFSAAVTVIDGTQTHEGIRELARGCTGLGRVISSLGDHQEGKKHLERAKSLYLTKLEQDNVEYDKVELARIYSFLGKVESRLENPEQAKKHFSSSLDVLRQLNLELDTDAAYTYRHLGAVQCDLNDYEEAEKNLQLALSICLKMVASNHVDVGRTFYHLGLLQSFLANRQQAKEYLEKARIILLEKLGTEHVEVARVYHCMGVVVYELGENHQAKKHFELALSIFKKHLGPDHQDVKQTTTSLRLCDNSP